MLSRTLSIYIGGLAVLISLYMGNELSGTVALDHIIGWTIGISIVGAIQFGWWLWQGR